MIRIASLIALCLAVPAWGQGGCPPNKYGTRDEIIAMLLAKHGEQPQSSGLTYAQQQPTSSIEVFANEETGTWTVVVTTPDGMACMVAEGQDWNDDLDPETPPAGDPA